MKAALSIAAGLVALSFAPLAEAAPRSSGGFSTFAPIQKPAPIKPIEAPTAKPFRPYQGSSVYSPRGGVNAYPAPAKPKGYIDIYGNKPSEHPFAY